MSLLLASCAPDPHGALQGTYALQGWDTGQSFHCVQHQGTPVGRDACAMDFPPSVTVVGDEPRFSLDQAQVSTIPGDQARYFPTDMTPYVDPTTRTSAVVWLRAFVPPTLELIQLDPEANPPSITDDRPRRPQFVLRGTTPTGVVQLAFDQDRRVLPFDPGPNEPGMTTDLPTPDLSNCVRTQMGPYCSCYMFWTYTGSVAVEDGTQTPDGVPQAVLTVQVSSHVRERTWLDVQHVDCGELLAQYDRLSPGRYVTNETLRLTYRRAAPLAPDHASADQATVDANPFNLGVWVKARPWWSRF